MIDKVFPIPTGYLFTGNYSKGQLETLSIGDYGKAMNVKADFLGYTREIHGVPNATCMPLSEKWVVTLSTQYGCRMKCTFCDVPNVPFGGNATEQDLLAQLTGAISLFPEIRYTERLNIHFARMGEPILNENVHWLAMWLGGRGKDWIQDRLDLRTEVIHPVLTTMLPRGISSVTLSDRVRRWCEIKNEVFRGQAGLQFSINSTNELQRNAMFKGRQVLLTNISLLADDMPVPLGRKYCLNFAYSTGAEIDPVFLSKLFDREKFMVKITPIHNNSSCAANGIKTEGGYCSWAPYAEAEQALREAGWDVIVFVPSIDEENGLVTCGNAILGGGELSCDSSVIRIQGIERSLHATA